MNRMFFGKLTLIQNNFFFLDKVKNTDFNHVLKQKAQSNALHKEKVAYKNYL